VLPRQCSLSTRSHILREGVRVHYLRLRGVKISPIAGVEAAERWNVEAFGIAMVTNGHNMCITYVPLNASLTPPLSLNLNRRFGRTANRNGIKTRMINAISIFLFAIFLRANINKSKVTTSRWNILLLFIYKKLLQFSQTSSALISCLNKSICYLSISIILYRRN